MLEVFYYQGSSSLLIDNKPIYPLLVKQFYANLVFNSNTRILKSIIKGRDIVLDDFSLIRIMNIPNKEWGIQSLSNWSSYLLSSVKQTTIMMFDDSIQSQCVPFID